VIENTEDKNLTAEERRQDTKRFVRQVRSATRRKYTPEEKIHIVLEGFRRPGVIHQPDHALPRWQPDQ